MENMNIAEAFELIDEGNFKKAGFICLDLVKQEPENAAVYVAMLMIEMQARNANQIKDNLHMYADSDNYKNAVKYDDGSFAELLKVDKRKAKKVAARKKKKGIAALVFVLVVAALVASYIYLLPMYNYNKATDYLKAKDYNKASVAFNKLGDYKDSEKMFETAVFKQAEKLYFIGDVSGCLTELERVGKGTQDSVFELRYDCAMSKMNDMDYISAAAAFEFLGDYKDSEQKMHNCYLYYACYLSDAGDREGTLKILSDIGLDEEDIFDMKYAHGGFLFDHQNYYDAKLHYAMLGDYRDCIEKVVDIDRVAGETRYTVTGIAVEDEEETVSEEFTDYSEAFAKLSENEGSHIYDDQGVMYY